MPEVLMHPRTELQVKNVLTRKPHALLLTGETGSGKYTLAKYLASNLLGVKKLEAHPYFFETNEVKKGGIDEAKEILRKLSKKTAGKQQIRRVLLLENIDKYSNPAQNTLLKVVEEPPEDTVFILTAADQTKVLTTIKSRTTRLDVLPLTKETAEQLMESYNKTDLALFMITRGLAGRLVNLLQNKNTETGVEEAKKYLQLTPYQRLCQADNYAKNSEQAKTLLEGLEICLEAAIRVAPQAKTRALFYRVEAVAAAKTQITQNANKKLLFSKLALDL